ncbi:Holliday junction resolvase RuvX [Rhodohalobacter sp. SW132]|uniref:Holliday junction resolvase RuvX n=1 Tax=Rhodohalobacter sp. SW132 TaxID=2293433 RepID=UPI000E253194|nr:Holliday junction resolvase RuvX [Rhodohalobacter sp. SW132]REL24942.1 Holliday junction resolvase RuvX [Rhodohalobacter sp. SW132]
MTAAYGRYLGIDVGSKRVGIARSDLFKSFASPVGTFSPEESFQEVRRQVESEGPIEGIVVGWPLTPQGDPTHSTELVKEYIKELGRKFPDIKIHREDERYSSRKARKILVESGVPKKKREEKGRVDQAAAAYLLQEFLDSNPNI